MKALTDSSDLPRITIDSVAKSVAVPEVLTNETPISLYKSNPSVPLGDILRHMLWKGILKTSNMLLTENEVHMLRIFINKHS